MNRHIIDYRIPFIACFFVFFSSLTNGQVATSLDSQIIALKPIQLTEISEYGTRTRALINEVDILISDTLFISNISNRANEVIVTLDTKIVELQDSTLVYQLNNIEKEQREFDLIQKEINSWKNYVTDMDEKCNEQYVSVQRSVAIWELTSDSINQISTTNKKTRDRDINSDYILEEVQGFNTNLRIVSDDLDEFLISINNIQTQIILVENKFGNATNLLSQKRDNIVSDIWFPESPPIWKAQTDTTQRTSKYKIIEIVSNDLDIVSFYLKNHPKLLYYAFLYFGIVLITILYLRIKSKKLYVDLQTELLEANIVLQKPITTSLIISWFTSLLFTQYPKEITDLISLMMLVPLIIILRNLKNTWNWRRIFYFIITYITFLLISRMDYQFLPQRVILLVVGILSLFYFLSFKKNEELVTKLRKSFYGTLSFFLQLYILLSICLIITNIIGNVQLARLLANAIVGTILSVQILGVAVTLLRNFSFLLIMGPLIKYSYILQEDKETVLRKMDSFFRALGFALLILIILNLFNMRKDVFDSFFNIINYSLTVGAFSISLGNILAFFISIQIAIWLSSFIRYVLEKEIFPRANLKEGVPNTISLMVRFTFALFGILIAFSAAGIEIDKLAIGMGALGVGIGFGLQNIFNNFVSGVILALERPITIGDIINIPQASGVVKDIGLRACVVRTWDGSDVIVPNGELISKQLTNWTYNDKLRRIMVEVRVPFDADTEKVLNLLLETAGSIPEVMKKPKPYLNFKGIHSSAMEVNLYCWINDTNKVFTYGTAIRKAVYKSLKDAGYTIPVPEQKITVNSKNDT